MILMGNSNRKATGTPETRRHGFGVGNPHKLYNKFTESDIKKLEGFGLEIVDNETVRIIDFKKFLKRGTNEPSI